MFEALHAAAERGVRVRLLLDDNGISCLDPTLTALDSHPNIEVRLFNPFAIRWFKALGYLTDFARANRRIHNKSLSTDNQVTIIGDRNVGDEHFGATESMLFADLDVLAVGPVVNAVSAEFDRYWTSESAYPVSRLLAPVAPEVLAQLASKAAQLEHEPLARTYVESIRNSSFIGDLLAKQLTFKWAKARMVSDDPSKGLGKASEQGMLIHQLSEVLGKPASNVDLVSPYSCQ